jgi:hypothetical protein
MTYHIRPAERSRAKPLVGIYGESGTGKTLSALFLCRGFIGPKGRTLMIETESGRGEAFVDDPRLPGGYDVISMAGNFSPEEYGKAITVAEAAKPDALIIDSASHEWEGPGGVLAMAAANQEDGKKGPLVWQRPKMDHARHFMLRLVATPIPFVILNMRAKYPMREERRDGRKEWVRSDKLEPKQSDDLLYEMFIHGWVDQEHRFHVTRYAREDMKPAIIDGEPITIATGERLAAWARGGQAPVTTSSPVAKPKPSETELPAGATWNVELAACSYCQGDVEPGTGFAREGKVIHSKCLEAKKAERRRA